MLLWLASNNMETTKPNCINLAWLKYFIGTPQEIDGYGVGFLDYHFNDLAKSEDLRQQLDTLVNNNVGSIRLWLNIYHYMNEDKDTAGYTSFVDGFLDNVTTYLQWCKDRDIRVMLVLNDSWYTLPYSWLADVDKANSLINACNDVVTAVKDVGSVYAVDFANEPYMGWGDTNPLNTIRYVSGVGSDVGINRLQMTAFFKHLYNQLKLTSGDILYSVGESKPEDNATYGLKELTDFYQVHHYSTYGKDFMYKASDYDQPVVVGEFGYLGAGQNAKKSDVVITMLARFIDRGFKDCYLWAFDQTVDKYLGVYRSNATLKALNKNVVVDKPTVINEVRYPVLRLNGSNSLISVPDSTSLNITGTNVSYSAWVYLNAYSNAWGRIFNKGYEWGFMFKDNGKKLHCFINTASQQANVSSISDLPLGEWVHLTTTYDGSFIKFYLNGRYQSYATATGNILDTSTKELQIVGQSGDFNGLITDLVVYNTTLNSQDILDIYYGGGYGDKQGLVCWLAGDSVSGDSIQDKSGNNNNGTLTNVDLITQS